MRSQDVINYKDDDSATAMYRAVRGNYGLHNRSTTLAIGKIVKKFEEAGVVTNIERLEHQRFMLPKTQMYQFPVVHELGLSYGTLWRILHLDLHLHPYKV